MALVRDYFKKTHELKRKYGENSIVLMQVGKFFEVYGNYDSKNDTYYDSNIYDFSIKCDCRISTKTGNIKMAGIPEQSLEKYVEKLQKYGYTIAIYVQDKNEKNTTRSLAMVCSPGTYFTNNDEVLSNNICVVNIYNRPPSFLNTTAKLHIGLACVDIISGVTNYFQHEEDYYHSPSTYDVIEKYYSIYKPSEVLICYDESKISTSKINDIIDFTNMRQTSVRKVNLYFNDNSEYKKEENHLSLMAKNCEKQNYQAYIFEQYYKVADVHSFMETHKFFENDIGCQAFCFLLDYIYSHNKKLIEDLHEPKIENLCNSLYLGNHSLQQLNIISSNSQNGKKSSVLSFLNNCITKMGKRTFKNNLLHPTTDSTALEKKYDFIEDFMSVEDYSSIEKHLRNICDLDKLIRKLILQKVDIQDIYDFYVSLNKVKEILDFMKKNGEHVQKHYTKKYSKLDKINNGVISFLKKKFNFKILKQQTKMNYIKPCIFSDLDECEQNYYESYDKFLSIQAFFSLLINSLNKKNVKDGCKIHKPEKTEYYLKVTKTRATLIQKNLQNFIVQFQTSEQKENSSSMINLKYKSSYSGKDKNFTFDTNIEFIKATANDMRLYSKQIQEISQTNLKCEHMLSNMIQEKTKIILKELYGFKTSILSLNEFITDTDLVLNNVNNAVKYKYCKPTISNDENVSSFINCTAMRHTLIEQLNQQEIYVPNDIVFDYSQKGILLYGTNAVGKSSLIKSIGICVIMAQAGCYVPCETFHYKPYHSIYTRILGNDNIFKGLSTFAVEMTELNSILNNADENTLVLGDELCSGTEMGSAISIFSAGLMHLHEKQSSFIFATHFHEIIHFEEVKSLKNLSLKHMSVVYDIEKDLLIYNRKLCDGPGNNNYGLEVCKSLNLPQKFLESANQIRMKYVTSDTSISSLRESKYNTEKIKSNKCELCNERKAEHIHHMQYQEFADHNNMIGHIHKNHNANLMSICSKCHMNVHKKNKVYHKKKSNKGYVYVEE